MLSITLGKQAATRLVKRGVTLRRLHKLSVRELTSDYGLTKRAARKVIAVSEIARRSAQEPLRRGQAFRSSLDIFRHFHARMRDLEVEQFRIVLLDGKHRVMDEHMVSQGTLTSSPVHPREVFREAIRRAAAAVVLVHNHPSGTPSPSADDLDITRRLSEVGELVGIRVLDHVIVGDGTYVSLADRALLR